MLYEFGQSITQSYDSYTFNKVIKQVSFFTNIQLSAFYFDIIKDRLYTAPPKSSHRLSAQYVMNEIYNVLSLCLAPILPHISEDIHNHYTVPKNKPESIFHYPWYSLNPDWFNSTVNSRWEIMRNTKTLFNKLYEQKKQQEPERIRSTLDIDLVLNVPNNSDLHQAIKTIGPLYGSKDLIYFSNTY